MSDLKSSPKSEGDSYVPPPPSAHSLTIMRFVFAMLALASFCGVWFLTAALASGWRFAIAMLVAAPFLFIPDLIRDKSAPPPGFKPRKWDDEDDEH